MLPGLAIFSGCLWAAIRGLGESSRIAESFRRKAAAARRHAETLRELIDTLPVATEIGA